MDNVVKYNKYKFFFIGWLIGVIPYIPILMLLNSVPGTDPMYYVITITLLVIIPIINGFNLSRQADEASNE